MMIDDEGASFAFLTPLMAMLFATTGGTLSSLIGRKRLIMSCMPFTGLGWLLIGLSNGKTMLFIGRIVTSIFMAFMTSSVSAYTAETVHPQIRGNLVVLSPFFLSLGMLFDWLLGYFFSWRTIAYVASIPCVLLTIALYFLPESPYWLIEKDRKSEAETSLKFYRGSKFDIMSELDEIHQKHLEKEGQNSWKWVLQRICSKAFLKPFSCIGVLYILITWVGMDIVMSYMVSILHETGSNFDPTIGPILAGIVRTSAAGLTPFFMGKISPKYLFTIGQLTMALCTGTIAFFAYWKTYSLEFANIDNFGWIPVTTIMLMILVRALATLPVQHTLLTELYPSEIRTQSISISESVYLGTCALALKLYPTIKNGLCLHGAFLLYTIMSILASIWGYVTIPDNRGKSLAKVEMKNILKIVF